jgi:hypothetical protein
VFSNLSYDAKTWNFSFWLVISMGATLKNPRFRILSEQFCSLSPNNLTKVSSDLLCDEICWTKLFKIQIFAFWLALHILNAKFLVEILVKEFYSKLNRWNWSWRKLWNRFQAMKTTPKDSRQGHKKLLLGLPQRTWLCLWNSEFVVHKVGSKPT